ncbi:ATP-dependent Clp protease adaptor ClpS [Akkermansiaceae bacterium]|nr:ATP-dependent Clp protease adaptor ClpS [Akkermansiaceae bacterium]
MADTTTLTETDTNVSTQPPWNVIVHDDPVNLMAYVTFVLMKIFGYNEKVATTMMLQVHHQGLSIVWSGELEKAEFYAQQLQFHQLKTTLEKHG